MEGQITENDFIALLDLTAKTNRPIKVLRAKREDGSLDEIWIKKQNQEYKIANGSGKTNSPSSYNVQDSGNILGSVGWISPQCNTFFHKDTKAYKRFTLIKVMIGNEWKVISHGK